MSFLRDWFSWDCGPQESKEYASELADRAKRYVRTECGIDSEADLTTYEESIVGLSYLLCLCQLWSNASRIDFEAALDELNARFLDAVNLPPHLSREIRTEGRGFVTQEINATRTLIARLVSNADVAEEGRKGALDWTLHYFTGRSARSSAARRLEVRKRFRKVATEMEQALRTVSESHLY